jgi:hypothetical protein
MAGDFLSLKVVGEKALLRNFDQLPDVARAIVLAKVEGYTDQLEAAVIESIDEKLQTKSGKLLSAVRREVLQRDGRIEGKVWIDENVAPHAAALEKGAAIPPHMIYPKNGKVMAFMAATGDKVFATRVFHPGSQITPRYFMKDARRSVGPMIARGLKKAVVDGIRAHMRKR